MTSDAPIPLTVLGGWLGAGKTTMVNRMLASTNDPIAVIVNDVGEINIDAALIRNGNDDGDVIELTNGCVCCKVGDDLFATVAELSRRSPPPQRIVLEASGVAEPRQVTGFLDHPNIRIDAVIALVDPKDFEYRSSGPPYGSLRRAQLSGADLVVATKLDLLPEPERQPAIDALSQFTKATIVAAGDDVEWLQTVMLGAHDNLEHQAAAEGSTASVATHTWRPTEAVQPAVIKAALRRSKLLRAKGSIMTTEGPALVHLAGDRVSIEMLAADVELVNAIVLIGSSSAQVATAAQALDAATVTS